MITNSAIVALPPSSLILPSTMANQHKIVSPNPKAQLFPMQQMQYDEVEVG